MLDPPAALYLDGANGRNVNVIETSSR